jgi:hypothetical protein
MRVLTLILWLALGAQQPANGSVEGTVVRTGTTEPIEGVQVTLSGASRTQTHVLTDNEGRFSFPNVAPGRYSVRVQRDGYLAPAAQAPAAMTINMASGQKITGLTYDLVPAGTISGRILDPQGRLAALATVTALRLTYQEGRPTVAPVKTASTNDRGEYRLFGMGPGDYYIRAEKALSTGPARAYFPGTDDPSLALKVRVSEGTESSKIDVSIQNGVSYKISGTVKSLIDGLNPEPPGLQFYLFPVESNAIVDRPLMVANALTAAADVAAGKFEIRNVQAGRYDMVVVLMDRRGTPARSFLGRARVNVPYQDVADIEVTVGEGADLPGKLTYSGTLPTAPRVQLRPKGLFQNLSIVADLWAVPAEDGTFTIFNAPDLAYHVSVAPLPPDVYITDIRQGSFSLFDVGAIGIGGRTGRNFEIVLDAPGATINGKVPASAQELAAGVAVALIPDERRRENLSLYKRTTVSASGTFSLTGVAPGRYKLIAWESMPSGAEFNAEFMDRYRDDGTDITVVPGDVSDVELRLIPK